MINVYFHVLDDVTEPIFKELRRLRPRDVKLWFNSSDYDKTSQLKDKSFIDRNLKDGDLCCFHWDVHNVKVSMLCDGLKHLAIRYDLYQTNFICIDNRVPVKNHLTLFLDAEHKHEHPKGFIHVPCFNELDKILDYLRREGIFKFSLDDCQRFIKTNKVLQGVTVYEEIGTKYYWYLDNFHKTHYEVFDSDGKNHLGEADLNGNLDRTKKDKRKKAIF